MRVKNGNVRTQPRPAFGRRPWFALLRRARSFLRFALAMGNRIPGRGDEPGLLQIRDGAGRWRPVMPCVTLVSRWRGLRPAPFGLGALIGGDAVHGFGMVVPVAVVAVDETGMVMEVRRLRPGARVDIPGAGWLLEIPVEWPAPTVGVPLAVRPMLDRCPAG